MRTLLGPLVTLLCIGCSGGGGAPTDGGAGGGGTGGGSAVDAGLLPESYDAVGYAVTVQAGKVMVVGSGGLSASPKLPDTFALRANTDLTLDPTFATQGYTNVDFDGGTDGLMSFTSDGLFAAIPDGDKLVATGFARGIVTATAGALIIMRFNADGSLDTTFNTRGYALYDLNPMSHSDNAGAGYSIAKRADGKYVFAGGFENGVTRGRDLFAYRINADGTTDSTFTPTPYHFGGQEYANDIVLQGNNTVLGGGEAFTICRLTDTGTLDLSFGTMGSVKSSGGTMQKLLARSDGKLLGIGTRSVSSSITALKLFQVSADGAPDTAFGPMGVKEIENDAMGMGPAGEIRGAAFAADGSLYVYTNNLGGSRIYKVRADGTLDTTWGTGGSKPTGFRINILSIITSQPRGANALTISGNDAWVTGSTLVEFSPSRTEARFGLTKIGL
ncbi:MAG: hypothetical protein JNK82_38020 [Myxococcaceae bacterium]|nr:hypothetical protein [Myxococcaceae bacterium]